jgi:hypothetical protein
MSTKTKTQPIIERDECAAYLYDKAVNTNYRLDSILFSCIKGSSTFDDILSLIFIKHPKTLLAFKQLKDFIEGLEPETSEEEEMLVDALDEIKYMKRKYKEDVYEEEENENEDEDDEDENTARYNQHVQYDDDLDF